MKSCFGYIRVSTQKQGEGASLEAQRDAITAFAIQHDLSLIEWFEEKETAAKQGRPVFTDMLKRLKRGGAAGLIMHKIDRSARNFSDWNKILALPPCGIDVYFATEGLDFRSRGGRLAANLQAVVAEDYIHNLREETIKGLKGRLKQGLYPFRAPIGYLDMGRGNPKAPCPAQAPLIQQAFQLYATGQFSILSLQAEMARRGLKSYSGKPPTKRGIETILNNPFYTGLIEIKRTGETYDGIHEPLISSRTFRLVQDIKSGKAGKKVTRHNHLYRGLFKCGSCGGAMIPERQKAHVYYRCHTRECPKNIVREDRLEQSVREALACVELSQDDAEQLSSDWQLWLRSKYFDNIRRSLDLRIAQTEKRLERLTDLLIDGAISPSVHHRRQHDMKLEIGQLKHDRAQLHSEQPSERHLANFLELMKSVSGALTPR